MQTRSLIVSLGMSLVVTLSAGQALAVDWAAADAAFAQREGSRAKVSEARAKYVEILNQVTESADKVRAVSQLGRLAVYEGEMLLPKTAREERLAIFSQCWCADPKVTGIPPFVSGTCPADGFLGKIKTLNHPAYHFFHGICLAYWGEQATLSQKLAFTSWIVDDIEAGQALDTRFEGGGINRLGGGVFSNPATKPLGIYDPAKALELSEVALAEQPYPGDPSGGANYYDNWEGKVTVLIQLHEDNPSAGYKQQAIALATDKLTEMDEKVSDDDLPAGRAAEFKFYYNKLKSDYKKLTGTDWNP